MVSKISIFASAHRPENWMQFYNSIGNNDVTFEVVFVGRFIRNKIFEHFSNDRILLESQEPKSIWI